MTAICARTPAFLSPRTLGFLRMQRSSLAEELVLSEAERRALSFLCRSVPRRTSVISLGKSLIDICDVKP